MWAYYNLATITFDVANIYNNDRTYFRHKTAHIIRAVKINIIIQL